MNNKEVEKMSKVAFLKSNVPTSFKISVLEGLQKDCHEKFKILLRNEKDKKVHEYFNNN